MIVSQPHTNGVGEVLQVNLGAAGRVDREVRDAAAIRRRCRCQSVQPDRSEGQRRSTTGGNPPDTPRRRDAGIPIGSVEEDLEVIRRVDWPVTAHPRDALHIDATLLARADVAIQKDHIGIRDTPGKENVLGVRAPRRRLQQGWAAVDSDGVGRDPVDVALRPCEKEHTLLSPEFTVREDRVAVRCECGIEELGGIPDDVGDAASFAAPHGQFPQVTQQVHHDPSAVARNVEREEGTFMGGEPHAAGGQLRLRCRRKGRDRQEQQQHSQFAHRRLRDFHFASRNGGRNKHEQVLLTVRGRA